AFGDGTGSAGFNTFHTYTKDSNFRVQLVASSDRGCYDTAYQTLTVFPKPFPQFSINDSDQCVNTNLYSFVNNTTLKYGTASYVWKYGNGDTLAGVQPDYHYAADGNFIITLKATTNFDCIDSAQRQVTVFPKPDAQFSVNDSDQCLNTNQFVFTGLSTIPFGGLTYQWTFSNGESSTQEDTTIVFTIHGPVTYTLINGSDYGCFDTASSAVYVYAVPEPDFTINDTGQCLNQNSFVFTSLGAIAEGTFNHEWTFGNEGTSTQANPVKVFTNDVTHNIKMKLESNFGCTDSITKQVIVFPSPNTSFIINDTDQCLNLNQFDFTGLSTISTGTITWEWSMGGGFTSLQQDTTIIYTTHGPYVIRLINRSDKGCEDTATSAVYVYATPDADFTINDTDQCLNENSFEFTSLGTIAEGTMDHQWTFGNEGSSTVVNPAFTFTNDITHTIKLRLESDHQCYDSVEKQVIVWPKPDMAFTINDTGQCVNGNTVTYTNQTTIKYGTLTYNWDLGAGITSVATDTTVIYPVYGFYQPRLIATSDNNCKDTLTKDVSIYPKPDPAFIVNDSDQCLAGNLYIINNQTVIGYGTIDYIWYWGNGDTASGSNPQYSYPADTIYSIKMVAASNWGCKDSTERQIIVYPQPVVAFTINDSGQCVNNNQFDFTNGSTVTYGTLSYNWNFANGKTSVAKDTSVIYTYDSTYRAVLRATTNFGCTDTVGKYVVVHSKPNPAFSTNDTDQCVNTDLFVHTNLTTIKQGTSTYDWTFGDGNTDTVTHPSHGYVADTTYRVRLLATSDFGCADSIIRFMLVFPKPQAAFTVNDSSQCINTNNFVFTNQSTVKYGTLTYDWQYGNGDVSTVRDPVYVYPLQGTYTVALIPRSNNNCYDTVTHLSILFPKPNPLFAINDTDQCLKTQDFIFKDSSDIDSGTYTTRWWFSDAVLVKDSLQVQRVFGSTGTYDVELLLTSDENCTDSIQRRVVVRPHPNPNFTGLKTYYCMDDTPLPLTPTVPGGTFTGLNMVNDTFAPAIPGFDTVRYSITVGECSSDTAKYTRVYPLPVLGLPPDTTLCRQEFLVFDVTFPGSGYLWQDGSTSPQYTVRNPGLYKVTLFHICDTLTTDINVTYLDYDCNYFFPNAFSPNGDFVNDTWLPYMEDVVEMHLRIFNRWGQMVFESTDLTKGWDGRYMGEPVQDGVYIWKVDLKIDESGNLYTHSAAGNLTLLR
ncbi:MAG TPA: PKD domain-containing protein, partial [Bacteroidia bacterium]|nr:PKD domain-containing protein [Bacteroidia bacterium]